MTKDGGMAAQSSVDDRFVARAEIRIAARIRPENSKVRSRLRPFREAKEHSCPDRYRSERNDP